MDILGTVLFVIGAIVSAAAGIWFLVVAFKENILWGIGCLLVPFVALVFLVMFWSESAKPFFISLAGTIAAVIGAALAGIGAHAT